MVTYRGLDLSYDADREALGPELGARFAPVLFDEATKAWIDDAVARPHGAARMAARAAAAKVMSDYDANGMLDMHDMRVLGTAQWEALLGGRPGGRLLDLGAGDGRVTAELARLVDDVVTTETSGQMKKRLEERGFRCFAVDVATVPLPDPGPYDLVTALNLLDRTTHPLTLLEVVRGLLGPGGRLVLAVPLPLRPHVHVGPTTVDPEELLPVRAPTWEGAALELSRGAVAPAGFTVERLARVPYLCRGSYRHPVAVLDDGVFVCRLAGDDGASSPIS